MSKPGKVLRNLCKKLGVRLTVKRGQKRVYKSVAVLKRQCANKKKKKKVVKRKRRRRFGMAPPPLLTEKAERTRNILSDVLNIPGLRKNITDYMGEMNKNKTLKKTEDNIKLIIERKNQNFPGISLVGLMVNTRFNQWGRLQYYREKIGKKLQKLGYFSNLNLEKANFNMSKIWMVSFESSNLEQAKFVESNIYRSNFKGANLKKVDFTNASAEKNNFSNCNMREANFTNANMSSCNLDRTDLRGADFTNAVLEFAIFKHADLRGADLERAVFETGINTFDSKPKFKHAIYDNSTRFPEGFNHEQHEIMHVDEWVKKIKSLYSAMNCIGGSIRDYITEEFVSRITHQIKLYEKKRNNKIEKFYKGNLNKFELRKYIMSIADNLQRKHLKILREEISRDTRKRELAYQNRIKRYKNATTKIDAFFRNKKERENEKKRKRLEKELRDRKIKMDNDLLKRKEERRMKISEKNFKNDLLKRLGGLGALGVLGGGAYLGSKYLKKKRRKRKKIRKRKRKVKKKHKSKK